MNAILALDQGTTSSRALVFDRAGHVLAVKQQEFEQIFPRPGWVEHNPEEIASSQLAVARAAIAAAGLSARDIAAIGITNQRETTILWERATGKPVANAIVWQDRRTAQLCEQLKPSGLESLVREKTGLVLDAYFSATKLRWLLDNVPGARDQAERGELAFGTVDSWLVWQLTGGRVHVTDVTNASRTLLFNIHTLEWDPQLLRDFGLPASILPRIASSSEVYGETDETVLPAGIPIAGIAGDQHAALFGQRCVTRGMAKNTYGTGCFMLMHTGEQPVPSNNNLITTLAWRIGGHTSYALEGSVFMAGATVQWLRDGLGLIKHSAEVEALAASVPDTGGVYLVPAFTGLGAPHWDPHARGTIVGMTRGTTGAHIARAALEAIAYQTADVLTAMVADAGIGLTQLRVDGGAVVNELLMQFQADILGVPVVRPRVTETTALGAAYLAGLAVGFWRDQAEIDALWQVDRTFLPNMGRESALGLQTGWHRALERARGWAQE